jgi:glycosyltransferase involved in cell wall biosynthesis
MHVSVAKELRMPPVLPPILCISNMAWDAPTPTNRQQLMRRFAERTQVAVVEAPLPVVGSFVGRSRQRTRQRGWRRDGNVRILQAWDWAPHPIANRSHALSAVADAAFRRYIKAQWRALGWENPVLWLYPPDSGDLLGQFDERLSIYHCVDDYAAIEHFNHYRRVAIYDSSKREVSLVRQADLMVVTAPRLKERWQSLRDDIQMLPNVADTALFATALDPGPEHPALAAIPAPRVCFIGALDAYKVDFTLLRGVASACPNLQFVSVGPIGFADQTRNDDIPRLPNLRYLETLPQAELPSLLRGCAVCLIPYHLNDYTASVSPLKLYEYLAAGCPVVATPLPALQAEDAPGLLLAPPDADVFAEQVHRALSITRDERHQISQAARSHSWERRIDELERLLLARIAQQTTAASG